MTCMSGPAPAIGPALSTLARSIILLSYFGSGFTPCRILLLLRFDITYKHALALWNGPASSGKLPANEQSYLQFKFNKYQWHFPI